MKNLIKLLTNVKTMNILFIGKKYTHLNWQKHGLRQAHIKNRRQLG